MRLKNELLFSVNRQRCLYFMTKTFRIRNNYTLDLAIKYAKKHALSLEIYIVKSYEENPKSVDFFHANTLDLIEKLSVFSHHVQMIERDEVISVIQEDIQAIYMDFAYLKFDLSLLQGIRQKAKTLSINLFQVESNVFVPVRDASDHEEYGAYTIRHKINKLIPYYDKEVLQDSKQGVGEIAALKVLDYFIEHKINHYQDRNDPSKDYTSKLSAYLKYGFISPVTIYHKLMHVKEDIKHGFLEEIIIRRELAYNYVFYNPHYDKFERITERWAYLTMSDHENDSRTYVYEMADYVHFRTHDPYFNAAMKQMIYLGYMHGYMRMYWAKKIIEWSESYEKAYEIVMTLNNRYFIDGLTPNGYTGVAWCFGKHDRPWKERPIFGKLRYMNDNGLKRKFDIDQYVAQMDRLERMNQS